MDPVTFLFCLAVAYVVFPVDARTHAATRGAFGAARTAARTGGQSAAGQWRASAPSRRAKGKARRDRWRTGSDGQRIAYRTEMAGRSAAVGTRAAWRASRAAASSIPDGYRTSAAKAKAKRAAKDAARAVEPEAAPQPAVTPAPVRAEAATPTRTDPKGPPVTDAPTITATELTNVSDFTSEAEDASRILGAIGPGMRDLIEWAGRWPDRYAATDIGTDAIGKAILGIREACPDINTWNGFAEKVDLLISAVKESTAPISEQVAAQGATGRVEAYAPA